MRKVNVGVPAPVGLAEREFQVEDQLVKGAVWAEGREKVWG